MTLEELLRQGKSFGQGASNAAASTVTGPVDMLAWLLRKGGVNVGDAPMGGEAWMRQKGLMATPENRLAGLLGEGAGLAAPIVAAAKAPEIAGGLLQMGRNLATPQTLNKQTGAIVYHGSPHKFDKFDSSKIGTGEGAQAYGHGLYLAESPDVADSYSGIGKVLNNIGESSFNGTPASKLPWLKDNTPEELAFRVVESEKSIDKAARVLERLGRADPDYKKAQQFFEKNKGKISWNSARPDLADATPNLYKVDLPDEHIAKMLDWDKPLSQQHPSVQEIFGKSDKMTGAQALKAIEANPEQYLSQVLQGRELTGAMIRPERGSSEFLKRKGIPGIRYLDGGSRSAGAGSSNFVVFPGNEGLLKILERNGGKP